MSTRTVALTLLSWCSLLRMAAAEPKDLQLLRPDMHARRTSARTVFEISPEVFRDDLFVMNHIPRTGGAYMLKFLNRFANVSQCQPSILRANDLDRTGMVDNCNFMSAFSNNQFSLSDMMHTKPVARYMTFVRDPLIQTLAHMGPLDGELLEDCALSSFVHSGGCLNLSDVSNMQTNNMGGGDIAVAVDTLQNMFWFGIFELFEASVCLLSVQLGQFNRDICDCDSPSIMRLPPSPLDKNDYESTALIEIGAMLRKDKFLYHQALLIFLKRVDKVETILGTTIICDHRDSQDIIHLKSLVSAGIIN